MALVDGDDNFSLTLRDLILRLISNHGLGEAVRMDRSMCSSQACWPSWSKFLFTVGFQFAPQSLDLLRVPAF